MPAAIHCFCFSCPILFFLCFSLIVGVEGTPYEAGLFQFDAFLPDTYPQTPPLFFAATTGNGTVRFNANLYSDGKVCLSLLGTFHGEQTAKWGSHSTLAQVLMGIQSQIMTADPFYTEPGNERLRGTDEGGWAF